MINVAKKRGELKLTQQELADAVHVSRTTIASIEGDPSYAVGEKLARDMAEYFGCSVYDISGLPDIFKIAPESKEDAIRLIAKIKENYL